MEAYFHIPEFYSQFRLNMILIKTMAENPEYFYEGIKIGSVYGVFPTALWNGGRYKQGVCDDKTIRNILSAFNELGVPCRYTFTNPLIEEKHLDNAFCNKLLKFADNGLNEVIVASDILEKYIRENYPNFKITSSTCKRIENMDDLNRELEADYNLVVLDYNWNNNFEALESIKRKDKCELLINACCIPKCPRRGEHYRSIGMDQINYEESKRDRALAGKFKPAEFECPYMTNTIYKSAKYPTHISPESLYGKYIQMGFSQFKIEGRSFPAVHNLEQYVYYMVKPEFKDEARLKMLIRLTA